MAYPSETMSSILTLAILLLPTISIQSTSPAPLLLAVLMIAFLILMTLGVTLSTFWYSYIMCLIFLGGLLILFTYTVMLSPNNKFNKISWKFSSIIIPIFFTTHALLSVDPSLHMSPPQYTNLYASSSVPLTSTLFFFLLFALLIIVSLTKFKQGPLRAIN